MSQLHSVTSLQVSCLGLEWRTEVSFKAVLDVIRDRTRVVWSYTDDASRASVVFYDPASVLAQALLRREAGHGARVLIPCGVDVGGEEPCLRLPIGASQLSGQLDRALERLPAGSLAGGEGLAQRLHLALGTPGVVGVTISSGGSVGFLSPRQGSLYWPRRLDADEVARLIFDDTQVRAFGSGEGELCREMNRRSSEMTGADAALWAIGVSTASTRLLRGIDAQKEYQLSRWPDFGVIGRKSADLRFAALMTQRAHSPQGLAARSGIAQSAVYRYFNASALCGLLDRAPAPATQSAAAAEAPGFMGSLVRGLRRALAMEAG